jgi:phosphoglycolate phosphatase-like HAD superfamily hydrolase
MRKHRCIVFDFDGTLVDSNKIKKDVFLYVASLYGGHSAMSIVLNETSGDRHQIMTAFSSVIDTKKTVDNLVVEYSQYADLAVAKAKSFPGAESLLRALHDSGKLVFLSSATPINSLREIINYRGWQGLFHGIYGMPSSKTNTLQELIKQEKLKVEEVAVVGDGEDDFESAKIIGCHFFPVGEARGIAPSRPIYSLVDLRNIFLYEESNSNNLSY